MDLHAEFLTLFLRHQDDLRAFIGSMIRDRAARDDVFQEVAVVLWQQFARYDSARPFGAWARGIAANKIMQRWNQSTRWPVQLSPTAMSAVLDGYADEPPAGTRQADALEQCLEALPEKSRRLLRLRYEQSLRPEQIAETLQSTTAAIHKSLQRVRQQLQSCIERRLAAWGDA